MKRRRILDVVRSYTVGEKGLFSGIYRYVSELNKSYGYNRFSDVSVKNVYYVSGCGTLVEFQDADKIMSLISDLRGKVVSCRLLVSGLEAEGLAVKYRCCVTPNSLILE